MGLVNSIKKFFCELNEELDKAEAAHTRAREIIQKTDETLERADECSERTRKLLDKPAP